jgi:hypothetical protein
VRFFFDECVYTSLTLLARCRGYEAEHVIWLGRGGTTYWGLMPLIRDGGFVFVTNNAADFRKLYAREDIHAGLVIIIPNVRGPIQVQLFEAFLAKYDGADLVNQAIDIRIEDGDIVFDRYDLRGAS